MSEPSLFEQLARRFETYADDSEAMIRRRYVKGSSARAADVRACTWRDAAKELRQIAADPKHRADIQSDIASVILDDHSAKYVRDYIMGEDS